MWCVDDKLLSKAQQVKALRDILSGSDDSSSVYGYVIAGKLPLAVHDGARDQIYQVIHLKRAFPHVNFCDCRGC